MRTMIANTSRCAELGHPEFRLTYDQNLMVETDVAALVLRLESSVADGHRYADGDDLQIGGMRTRLVAGPDGTLAVWEPDMVFFPPHWVESVNHCLIHLRLHSGVVASFPTQTEILFPTQDDGTLVSEDLGEGDILTMYRREPGEGFSGWHLCSEPHDAETVDPTHLRRLSLYEAITQLEPRMLPYLALPVGSRVELGSGGLRFALDGEAQQLRPSSLLDQTFPQS